MRAAGLAALGLLAVAAACPVRAAELVAYETPNCAYCIRWQRDIGQHYATTKAGQLLPLRRVDMSQPIPADLAAIPTVRAIPTFVLVECGHEIGRVTGYGSASGFWNDLARLVNGWQEAGVKTGC